MMDKTDFLELLTIKLRDRGIEEEVIVRQVAKFKRHLDFSESDTAELGSDFDDIDTIADEISILLKKRNKPAGEDTKAFSQVTTETPQSDTILKDEPNIEKTYEPVSQTGIHKENADLQAKNAAAIPEDDEPTQLGLSLKQSDPEPKQEEEYSEDVKPGLIASIKAFFSADKENLTEAERAGYRMFWSLFALSIPVTLSLCIAVLALFGSAYISLMALIVALIGGVITVAAGGTALSLIGIIYGVTQLFDYVPVGVYEIGFGVAIGGGAMFFGIAMYNIALRLIPYTIKKLTVFFKYTLKQAKQLFILAKGACVKI